MKERVFYVINLDKQRIGILSLFLFALFFSVFFLGVSVGKGRQEISASTLPPQENVELPKQENLALASQNQTNRTEEMVVSNPKSNVSMEVPLADVNQGQTNTNPYYAETSTAKDEEEEAKSHVIDLNKQSVSRKETSHKKKEVALKNVAPKKEKKAIAPEAEAKQKLYTLQLGAFGQREAAESLLTKVNQSSTKAKAFIVFKNGYFVVQMGKTSDKDSLKKIQQKLPLDVRGKSMVVSFIPLH
ncbi:sporulation and cell division repeat protein [Leptospira ryugenii]|uniref:Sporulation and cell division repeat protein n=1 Tax=Leptospira ryugenii TaxID=1917863 RepID=A0A2P2DXM6_9LEPT|nr:SPOR domain-containing protein [Leptospira ryugenii]GBF49382.1 sporulation and cell division repeat protein [Leptospira ryugenii]